MYHETEFITQAKNSFAISHQNHSPVCLLNRGILYHDYTCVNKKSTQQKP